MAILGLIILTLLTFLHTGVFASNLTSQASGLADIPPCGIQCMFIAVPTSGCLLNDFNCICNSDTLTRSMSACLLENCTMAETQGTARVQANICNLSKESKRTEMFWYSSILYAIGFLTIAMRIAGKMISKRLAWDDWVLVGALLFTTLPLTCVFAMTNIGFGEHLWNLEDNMLMPILRYFYIAWATYILVLTLIKISLVIFYLEIFDSLRFKITAYIVLVYIITTSIVSFLITIFVCRPVSFYWNRDIEGKCMDPQVIAYACSACAIVQDLILLILPLAFIRNLQMMRHRKIGAILMFSIGSLGCIATIIRLHTLTTFRISVDPTWDYVSATIWTEVELAAGSICVSLPSIRILIIKTMPGRVKNIFSHIGHSLRNRNKRKPKQGIATFSNQGWKTPPNWNIITAVSGNRDASSSGESFMALPVLCQSRDGSLRPESAHRYGPDIEVSVSYSPYPTEQRQQITGHLEMY